MTTIMGRPNSTQQGHLSSDALAYLRDLLVAELARSSIDAADHEPVVAESPEDADGLVERELAKVVVAQRAQTGEELSDALARIDAGAYGTCQTCRAQIPFERLEAVPQARFCVSCQNRPSRLLG